MHRGPAAHPAGNVIHSIVVMAGHDPAIHGPPDQVRG
ncbi:hypothetical protein MTBSS4_40076 [Magnetospirillum sp. SS-4]|nr:hypothetical protein MTBSS4_40076 [Magnetospirillum sp. SS-4]